MELDTVARVVAAFYRLVGTESADPALTDHGESTDDVAYGFLTRGCRTAQRYMIRHGYAGWRKRSSAIAWTGADATTGGRYWTLPTDFLRAWGTRHESCLREADGDGWGQEIAPTDDMQRGSLYYFRDGKLWIARSASPPTTLYLEYTYAHPAWSAVLASIDFPMDARPLIVAEAANVAKEEDWFPLDEGGAQRIERARMRAQNEVLDIARQTKSPRRFRNVNRVASHY